MTKYTDKLFYFFIKTMERNLQILYKTQNSEKEIVSEHKEITNMVNDFKSKYDNASFETKMLSDNSLLYKMLDEYMAILDHSAWMRSYAYYSLQNMKNLSDEKLRAKYNQVIDFWTQTEIKLQFVDLNI